MGYYAGYSTKNQPPRQVHFDLFVCYVLTDLKIRGAEMKLVIVLVSLAALGLALAIAVAGPGTRYGFWEYGTGLTILRESALPVLIASGAAALGFVLALIKARGLAPLALFAAIAAGGAGMVPLKMKELVEANPFIHDITTDFENPPAIITAADLPRKNPAAYAGAEPAPRSELSTAEAQRSAFPDIRPQSVNGGVDETAETVRKIVLDMNMEILSEGPTEAWWVVEATYTSTWFGFVDDFIVRLTPEGSMTRIDVRSKSRVGASDLGANAKRVQEFFTRLGHEVL